MSVVRCDCCDEMYDQDVDDGSYSDDGGYLCSDCEVKE